MTTTIPCSLFRYPIQGFDADLGMLSTKFPVSRVLSMGLSPNGELSIWGLHPEGDGTEHEVTVTFYATGALMVEDPGRFLSTMNFGGFVWHAFVVGEII